jgi:hypothetical protein
MELPDLGVPYDVVATRISSQPNAWLPPGHRTIKLRGDLRWAMRAHLAGTVDREVGGSDVEGRWFAVGQTEHITTAAGYTESVALKFGFVQTDLWMLPAGSVLNVGWASPLFGRAGGGFQAELVPAESPSPVRTRSGGRWANRIGHA